MPFTGSEHRFRGCQTVDGEGHLKVDRFGCFGLAKATRKGSDNHQQHEEKRAEGCMGAALHVLNGWLGLDRAWPWDSRRRSIRDILPSNFVADEVEGAVKHRGDDDQRHHRQTQFFCGQHGRAEEELAPKEDHDGKRKRIQ